MVCIYVRLFVYLLGQTIASVVDDWQIVLFIHHDALTCRLQLTFYSTPPSSVDAIDAERSFVVDFAPACICRTHHVVQVVYVVSHFC